MVLYCFHPDTCIHMCFFFLLLPLIFLASSSFCCVFLSLALDSYSNTSQAEKNATHTFSCLRVVECLLYVTFRRFGPAFGMTVLFERERSSCIIFDHASASGFFFFYILYIYSYIMGILLCVHYSAELSITFGLCGKRRTPYNVIYIFLLLLLLFFFLLLNSYMLRNV